MFVLCSEVCPLSECPLSEVSRYKSSHSNIHSFIVNKRDVCPLLQLHLSEGGGEESSAINTTTIPPTPITTHKQQVTIHLYMSTYHLDGNKNI